MAVEYPAIPGQLVWGLEEPTPSIHPKPQQHIHEEVYGVTNRSLETSASSGAANVSDLARIRAGIGVTPSVKYYVADVELTGSEGDWHAKGGPAYLRLVSQSEFDAAVKRHVSKPGLNQGKLGVYIHGICNSADDAAKKAAEISADGHETIVAEDWSSTVPPRTSTTSLGRFLEAENMAIELPHFQWLDYANARIGQPMIDQSIDHLIDQFHAPNIDLVAHSRGNSILVNYLASHRRTDQSPGHGVVGEQLRSVTLGHADISDDDFVGKLPRFASASHDFNIVYDRSDKALLASKYTNAMVAAMSAGLTFLGRMAVSQCGFAADSITSMPSAIHQDRLGRGGPSSLFPLIDNSVKSASNIKTHFLQDLAKGDPLKHALSSELVGDILRAPSKMPKDNTASVLAGKITPSMAR